VVPDEPLPVVEVGGGCFLQSGTSNAGLLKPGLAIAAILVGLLACLFVSSRRNGRIAVVVLLVSASFFSTAAHAGFFAVGGGAGGEAGTFNISMETGAKDWALGYSELMFAFGIPFIPHGDENIPQNTIALPCPNDECKLVGEERKGTEVGFYGKLGIEIASSNLYVNAIGGFTVYTESELVQSPGSGAVYEESTDTKLEPLYGAGFSYFPENWKWPIVIQLDYDTTRGATGTIGWYW